MSEQVIEFKKKERVKKIDEVKDVVFSELRVLNVILTNACNLSCSYCFEQHKKDYGKFTVPQLKQMYDFLAGVNTIDRRVFQFFGGEPLAQKKLILEFCKTYAEELSAKKDQAMVSIVTNALLLTPEFIEEYFSYDFTQIVVSLDSDDAAKNKRELTQDNIEYIFSMIELIPDEVKSRTTNRFAIRCTINEESVPRLPYFMDRLYACGVHNFVIHPLIMSREDGIVEWQKDTWEDMHGYILAMMFKQPNFAIHWAEGVGIRGESNCMIGSDMIAMDASGDFSGCYFLTNLKADVGHTMLGNLFKDEIYVDRYVAFQKAYLEIELHEQCQSCEMLNFCYQCPAGNAATSGLTQLFRPDAMCQRIVKLFLDLRKEVNRKKLIEKFRTIVESQEKEGNIVLARTLLQLIHVTIHNEYVPVEEMQSRMELPDYTAIVGAYINTLEENQSIDGLEPGIDNLIEWLWKTSTDEHYAQSSIWELYKTVLKRQGKPFVEMTAPPSSVTEMQHLALLHALMKKDTIYERKFDPVNSRSQILDL